MRQRAGRIFQLKAGDAERLRGGRDLSRHRLRRTDIERAAIGLLHELVAAHRRPAALLADAIAHGLVIGPELLARLRIAVGDIARRMHADRLDRALELLEGALVEVDIGREPFWIAADDRQHQRQVVTRRAYHGLGAAADADPGFQPAVLDWRKHTLVVERRAQLALPVNRLLLQELGEQVELLLEQRFILAEVETEQREGFGERAAAQDHFGASVGYRIDGRKTL